MNIGKKVYFVIDTGEVIVTTAEKSGEYAEQTTREQDFRDFVALRERNPDNVGMIELEYGQYAEDFMQSNSFRINPETLEMEFSYPDPDVEPEEPIFQAPLTQQLKDLKDKYAALQEESTVNQFALMELHMMILQMQNGGEAV